jgi:hypothetical protein
MHWNKKVPTLTIVHKLPIFSVQNTNLACELSKSDALARSRDCFLKHDEASTEKCKGNNMFRDVMHNIAFSKTM